MKVAQFALLIGWVTWLSLLPHPGEIFEHFWDKALHTLCWLVSCLSLRLALPTQKNIHPAALGLFLYSGLVEIAQYFMPLRQFSTLDIIANGVGVLLALSCIRLWQLRRSQ